MAGNDAGLAVAGLNFPGYARYESAPQEGKTNVSAWEFPLWVCANFESVDQVVDALRTAAIVDEPIAPQWPSTLLHWIVADRTRSVVVEYTDTGMQVFDNPVDVLANQPGYSWHAENLRNYLNVSNVWGGEGPLVALSPRLARAPPSAGFPATTRPLRALSAPRT